MLPNGGSPYHHAPYSPASSTISSADSTASGHQPRQRLRPWLIDQINSGEIPGLMWIDKEKMIFKIPWKHFGRPGVDEHRDAMLFRNWAIHTKKFKVGDQSDISTWKTRFRCALHKLSDIDELNSMNQTEGDEPYRVYQFKKKEMDSDVASSVGSPLSLPMSENPVVLSPMPSFSEMNNSFSNQNQIQDDVDTAQLMSEDLDLPNIDEIEDLELVNNILHGDHMSRFNSSGNAMMNTQPVPAMQPKQISAPHLGSQSVTSLSVKLYYADQDVGEKIVDNPRGLRIAFNPPPPLPKDVVKEDTSEVVSHIFGPFQAEQIYFPPSPDQNTMKILECVKRGLVLQARNGEILATRLCRAKVFYSDSVSPTEPVKELPREHTTVIYDYANEFLPKLKLYMQGQGARPTCERYFSFGQKWSHSASLKNNFIYISVTHCLAQEQLMQLNRAEINTNVLISDPNMLDIIAKQIEEISFNNVSVNGNM